MLFYIKVFAEKALSKTRTRTLTRTLNLREKNPLKNEPVQKTGRQGLKTLPFDPCHIEENVIKTSVEVLIFVQKTFEECIANACFENGKVVIKTTIANLQLLLV